MPLVIWVVEEYNRVEAEREIPKLKFKFYRDEIVQTLTKTKPYFLRNSKSKT